MASFKKLDSGKWQAQVARSGVRKSKTFPTKIKAKDWAAGFEHQINTQAIDPDKPTGIVADLFLRYERDISRKKAGARWEALQIKRLCNLDLGKCELAEVSKLDVVTWRDDRLRSVQGSTVSREMTLVSNVFNVAWHEWGLIDHNPCSGVKRPKENPPRDRIITQDEINKICVVAGFDKEPAQTIAQHCAVAFLFAIETGMRAGEIVGLHWKDVHTDRRYVHLPRTKNGSSRDVPLSGRAVELLGCLSKSDPCFSLTSRQLDVNYRKIRSKAAIDDLHFHDTRHEATRRLSKKLGILALARMIGHRDLKMLQIYYNESAEEMAKSLD